MKQFALVLILLYRGKDLKMSGSQHGSSHIHLKPD